MRRRALRLEVLELFGEILLFGAFPRALLLQYLVLGAELRLVVGGFLRKREGINFGI